jgi:hypothetical protein
MNYRFNRAGSLSGHAFTLNGLAGLREKVRQIESGSGISAGYNGCEQLGATRPADDETGVPASDFEGAGWYLTKFDGGADRFDTEAEALVAYIEERTETRNV